MSANNFILVKEYKDTPRFCISMEDADCEITNQDRDDGFDTLEGAIKAAHNLVKECEEEGYGVEYGIVTHLLD